jgi:hypothetical protein
MKWVLSFLQGTIGGANAPSSMNNKEGQRNPLSGNGGVQGQGNKNDCRRWMDFMCNQENRFQMPSNL